MKTPKNDQDKRELRETLIIAAATLAAGATIAYYGFAKYGHMLPDVPKGIPVLSKNFSPKAPDLKLG